MKTEYQRYDLPQLVGKGYGTYWRYEGRYRVCKGSRASKKSKTTALNLIYRMMKYPAANLLVIRKTYRTLHDSCFAELKWAIHRFGADAWWKVKESPLEMEYTPTRQKIYFRGLDDPLKVTSITVDVGCLCWMWIEEAYEVTNENDFSILDESIRGEVPPGLFKQITLTFNPWNERHWLKSRFFDNPDSQTLAMTTTYLCNEWLDENDIKVFQAMRIRNPRRYRTAGLGEWGTTDGLVYENWREEDFDIHDQKFKSCESVFGMDFGYTNDPTALFCGLLDKANNRLYVFDELYEKALTNKMIAQRVTDMGYCKETITADSAEPKSIDELRSLGLRRIKPAQKGRDSIQFGIQWLQNIEIIVKPICVNFITEISNYVYAVDKFGKRTNEPIDDMNHLMDAMRYACEKHIVDRSWLM